MAVTPAQFRQNFPEFADNTLYPETMVTFWLDFADKLLYDLDRWSDLRDHGIQLVVAHQLVLAARATAAASSGGAPGAIQGGVSSKSVGGVSVGYDVGSVVLENAGHWNMTQYGIQFWSLAMVVGTGGFQL